MNALLPYPLASLDKRTFDLLCLSILKRQISPNIRLVSIAGADGGRDAVLNGPCTTGRYTTPATRWIFQFKQYETDLERARAQAQRDFWNEANLVLSRDNACQAYIFLTSVPFSGTLRTGLFDKISDRCEILSNRYNALVDFWDGIELCHAVNEAPQRYSHFFRTPRGVLEVQDSHSSRDAIEEPPYLIDLLDGRSDPLSPDFHELLFPSVGPLGGPGASSPLWQLVTLGRFTRLKAVCEQLLPSLRGTPSDTSPRYAEAVLWTQLLIALSHTQRGDVGRATRILRGISRESPELNTMPEVYAGQLNLRSIVAGKLGQERTARRLGMMAASVAERTGQFWLSSMVRIRLLHREDWNRHESGQVVDDSLFERELSTVVEVGKYSPYEAQCSLQSAKAAVQALHYTWQPELRDTALNAAQRALKLLSAQPDHEENARMISEIGRLHLRSFGQPEIAINQLLEAAQLRAASDSLARLRYDLCWLAEAHQRVGDDVSAEHCVRAAMTLHQMLYRRRTIDRGLARRVSRLQKNLSVDNSPVSYERRVLERLRASTGIPAVWWEETLKRLRGSVG